MADATLQEAPVRSSTRDTDRTDPRLASTSELTDLAQTDYDGSVAEFRIRQHLLDNLRSARHDLLDSAADVTLRPHQRNVYNDLIKTLENGAERGWIKLPTGAGKTALFASIAEACGLRTLVLVPNKNLVKQTASEFGRFAPGTEVSTFYSENHSLEGKTVISTYQSLSRLIQESEDDGEQYDLVICDEAHRAIGGKRPQLIQKIPGAAFTLGLTATPDVSRNVSVARDFGVCVHEMNLPDAIRWGILTGVEVRTLQTTSDLSTVSFSASGEASERDLEKAINFEERVQAVIEIMKLPENAGKSFVAYWSSVKQAKEAAERLQAAGISCSPDTGDMEKGVREKNIHDHRAGIVQGMATKKTLVEGWDAPIVEVVFMCHPTMSAVDAEQRLGRALRLHTFPDGREKQIATVYDFVDLGKKGVLASEVLGGTVQLLPERLKFGEERETHEGQISAPAEIILSGDLKVLTAQEDLERLVNSYSPDVRITRDRLETFLYESIYSARQQIETQEYTAHSAQGPQQVRGSALIESFANDHKGMEGVTLDESGLRKLARYCKWIQEEVDMYLEIKKEVEVIHQHAEPGDEYHASLHEVLKRQISRQGSIPSMSEFAARTVPMVYTAPSDPEDLEVVAVSGQTILGYLGITTGEEYLYFLMEQFDELDSSELSALEALHSQNAFGLNEIQVRLSEKLNMAEGPGTRSTIARFVAQKALSLLGEQTIHELSDATINIKRNNRNPQQTEGHGSYQKVKFIGMHEYLEGLRRTEGLEANRPEELLSNAMLTALARKSGRNNPEQIKEIVQTRNERMAIRELADADLLVESITTALPELALLSEHSFLQATVSGADGQNISGAAILEYFTVSRGVESFESLAAHVLPPEEVIASRTRAREELTESLPTDIVNWRPEALLQREFTLANGTGITGADVLALFGYADATPENAKHFATQYAQSLL